MFVGQKKYDAERENRLYYQFQSEMLLKRHNELVHRINKLGGEDFLDRAKLPEDMGKIHQEKQFSTEELKRLIQLCHPDKHQGKPMAVEMTAMLVRMKG